MQFLFCQYFHSSFFKQVVTGGHYDVDVVLKDPNGKILYDQKKKQYDSHQFKAEVEGKGFIVL